MMKTKMINSSTSLALILTAAGSSTRMGLGKKKEYLPLKRGSVLSEAARVFLETADFSHVIITVPKNGAEEAEKNLFADNEIKNLLQNTSVHFVEGSDTRQKSIYNALTFLKEKINKKCIVLIHDAARPFVTRQIIEDTLNATKEHGAAVPVIDAVDTQKEISSDGTISRHLVRSFIKGVQTPQGFFLDEITECHKEAAKSLKEFTDDTEIYDAFPHITGSKKVFTVKGDLCNKKITYASDIEIKKENMTNETRIGFGTDLHRLAEGRKFYLGGIEIPSEKGEAAHSDGDVLLHAISDALLGASGLGDIGSYFPPEDDRWKDADSKDLLKKIWSDIKSRGWRINNMDCVVETEKPKFLPWREKVIDSIASVLEIENSRVFVKAKTNEKLDAVGEGNAIKAYCVCMLYK